MVAMKSWLRRTGFVLQLFLVAVVTTGCLSLFNAPSPPDISESDIAFLRSKPAYVFVGAHGEMKIVPSAYSVSGREVMEPLRGQVRFVRSLDWEERLALASAATEAATAELGPDGVFRAQQPGVYEIKFSNIDRTVELTVPVTVTPESQADVAALIMAFTSAIENRDEDAIRALLTDDFAMYSSLYGAEDVPMPVVGVDDLLFALPVIASWQMSDISVRKQEPNVTIVEGISTLETVQETDYTGTLYGLVRSRVTVHVVEDGGRLRIREAHFDRIPVDDSNWPNVKARYVVPEGSVISVEKGFEYWDGYVNEGGSGYFVILETLTYPGGDVRGWMDPHWIGAGESLIGGAYSYIGLSEAGRIVLEVRVLSGPAPNQLVETDRQVFEYWAE